MGEIIIAIAILLVSILLSGAVFTVLWEWFVVPIGVKSVSLCNPLA